MRVDVCVRVRERSCVFVCVYPVLRSFVLRVCVREIRDVFVKFLARV